MCKIIILTLKVLGSIPGLCFLYSVWKSGHGTAKRPLTGPDRTAVRSFSGPGFRFLKKKDRKKTGPNEPVLTG